MSDCIGKIIRIVDEHTIIVNIGQRKLSRGENVQVYAEGEPIVDLSGKALGSFIYIKDELEVVQVEENYSVCKKQKQVTVKKNPAFALSPLLERTHEQTYTKLEPLNVDSSEIKPLASIDTSIHIGDNIRKCN